MNIQIQILKNTLNKYDDKSAFSNYDSIAKKYHKLYTTITKEKKGDSNNNEHSLWTLINDPSPICREKLKDEIKRWFFSLPMDARIKVVTIENEWVCHVLYQLYYFIQINSHTLFKPKESCFNSEPKEEMTPNPNSNKKTTLPDKEDLTEDGIIYPPNKPLNTIKLTKEKKNKECTTVIYSQENLDDVPKKDLVDMNLGNFFYYKSMKEEDNNFKWPVQLLRDIHFYSSHYTNHFPDCVTLSPAVLIKEDMFENAFKMCLQNNQYFQALVQPFYSAKTKNYSYMLPDWMDCNQYYTFFQFLFGFFEQAILIKFILNYSFSKKSKHQPLVTSLINESSLDRFFQDRENVINYMNVNFPIETKPDLFNKTIKVEEIYAEIENDKQKIQQMKNFKTFMPKPGTYQSFTKNMKKSPELTASEMETYIIQLYHQNGNIDFVDKLIYHNITSLWNMTMFVKGKIFTLLIKLNVERNCFELIIEESNNSNRKHNKKKGKHGVHEDNSRRNQKDNKDSHSHENDLYSHYSISQSKQLTMGEISEEAIIPIVDKSNHKMTNENMIGKGTVHNKEGHVDQSGRFDDFFNEIEASDKQYDSIKNSFNNSIETNDFNHFINNNSNKQTGVLATGNIFSNSSNNTNKLDEDTSHQNTNTITSISEDKVIQQENNLQLDNKKEELKDKEKEDIDQSHLNNKTEAYINNNNSISHQNHSDCNNKDNSPSPSSPSPTQDDSITASQELLSNSTNTNNTINNISPISNPKKEKKQTFYLFDTSKKKKGKKEKHPFLSKDFQLYPNAKKQGAPRSFFEKLHNDILLYDSSVSEIMALTTNIKNHCIAQLEESISISLKETMIDYEKDVYGSFATGLMIEVSDVDIRIRFKKVVSREEFDKVFNILVNQFINEKKYEMITPIATASVPVIKLLLNPEYFIENNGKLLGEWREFKESSLYKTFKFDYEEINKIKIDITFLRRHSEYDQLPLNDNLPSISSVSYAQNKIMLYPEVKLLIRVMKRYFYIKKMNNSFNGGLSSFNLFLIILSFVQFKRAQNNQAKINLGSLLYDLLDFFGKFFDFRNYCIDVTNIKQYIFMQPLNPNDHPRTSLVILDPLTGFNASKSSYRIDDIQGTFNEAYAQFTTMKNAFEQSSASSSSSSTTTHSSPLPSAIDNFVYSLFGILS